MSDVSICESTVAELHRHYKSGELNSKTVVEEYLDRIETYDQNGPEINSIVSLNPGAKKRAEKLDQKFNETGEFIGPLHGIPVLLKDQVETQDIPTSFGSTLFEEYVPEADAPTVEALRDAGAIIIAKTNMPDWASTWIGYSSVTGRTKNPYSLDRDPGGSSSGTGAGVAANFGTIGVGEDTGGSIRVPAAFNNLFGIRVTTGLISRTGASPLVTYQDTLGPITRTVEDLTKLLDVMVGYDPADSFTAVNELAQTDSYTSHLVQDGFDDKRIGVLRSAFGDSDEPRRSPVNDVVESAIDEIDAIGAEIVDPVEIPDLDQLLDETVLYLLQSKHTLNSFLQSRPDAPAGSVKEIYDSGEYHELLGLFEDIAEDGLDDPTASSEYWESVATRERFQRMILSVFAEHDLDAILYPSIQTVPPTDESLRAGEWDPPSNPLIAPQSGCPAVSVPGGLTDDGLPVGVEFMGKPYSEPTLIEMAYAYEQHLDVRSPPESAPIS